jgi:hypothetical protein
MKIYIGTKKFDSWVTVQTFKEFKALLKHSKVDAVFFDHLEADEDDGEIIPLDTKDCAHYLTEVYKGKKLPEVWVKRNLNAAQIEGLINMYNRSYKHNGFCVLSD